MVRFTRQQEQSLVAAAFMVAVAVFIWVVLFAAAIEINRPADADEIAAEYDIVTHVVQPGETLWGIAQRYRPNEDPRKVVIEIQVASGIDSALIREYQLVLVPIPSEGGV